MVSKRQSLEYATADTGQPAGPLPLTNSYWHWSAAVTSDIDQRLELLTHIEQRNVSLDMDRTIDDSTGVTIDLLCNTSPWRAFKLWFPLTNRGKYHCDISTSCSFTGSTAVTSTKTTAPAINGSTRNNSTVSTILLSLGSDSPCMTKSTLGLEQVNCLEYYY